MSYDMALAGHKGPYLRLNDAAASFLPHDVFAFVKGGTGAIMASPLDPFARVIMRSLLMGTNLRKHYQGELAGGGWWGRGNTFGFRLFGSGSMFTVSYSHCERIILR